MEQFFYANLEGKLWAFRQYAQTFFRLFIIPIIMNLSLWSGAVWAKDLRCSDLLRENVTKTPTTDTAILAQDWRQLYRKKLAGFFSSPISPQKISTYQPDQAFWDARQALADAYEGLFQRIKLQESEMQILDQALTEFPRDLTSLKVLEEYLLFVRTLKKTHQPKALREISTTLATAKDKSIEHALNFAKMKKQSSWQNKFWLQQKRIDDAYQSKKDFYQKESHNVGRYPELAAKSQDERDAWAEAEAQKDRIKFRDKWNGCHTHGKTPEYSSTRNKFLAFSLFTGTASSLIAFSVNNRNFLTEGQSEIFFRRFKYELAETMVWRLLSYFITVADNWSFLAKSGTYIGIDNALSLVSGKAWDYFVGSKEQKDERPLQAAMEYVRTHREISSDLKESQEIDTFLEKVWRKGEAIPLFREMLTKLMNLRQVPSPEILQRAGLLNPKDATNGEAIKAAAEKYWQQFGHQSLDKDFLIQQGLLKRQDQQDEQKVAQANDLYWQNFGRLLQDDDQVRALMTLVAKDIYIELTEDAAIRTGSSMADRYGFYSGYSFFMVPTDLWFMQMVYRALCMTDVAPQYFARAALYFVGFRLFVNFSFEHTLRKQVINQ